MVLVTLRQCWLSAKFVDLAPLTPDSANRIVSMFEHPAEVKKFVTAALCLDNIKMARQSMETSFDEAEHLEKQIEDLMKELADKPSVLRVYDDDETDDFGSSSSSSSDNGDDDAHGDDHDGSDESDNESNYDSDDFTNELNK
ncbi:hypothetical protein QVD17_00157 [Tagetes erecta]|uniref:Uncharacterized protein n=1 Tax=Tagetes erecta TaxID=13708 RepID=A0AAD8P6Z0_TARER|nr:hypothetical protein QVD17_00157 [Tagetes erecta]